jgi:hypothetical protein
LLTGDVGRGPVAPADDAQRHASARPRAESRRRHPDRCSRLHLGS